MKLCRVSIRTQRGYEAFLDGLYKECYKDSMRVFIRILSGFNVILVDSYKDFYKDSIEFL